MKALFMERFNVHLTNTSEEANDLVICHSQAQQWLNELSFWKEEMNFFEDLLAKNSLKNLQMDQKAEFEKLQNQIIYYKGELLDQYEHDIKDHEKQLANLIQNAKDLPQDYFQTHSEMAKKLDQLENDFKALKRELFGLVSQLN